MPVYLVAFIISEFECRANPSKNFFVCSRPTANDQTEFSLNVGQQLLAEYDDIFDYNYSTHMSKLTLAAIPDFEFGAMENWGMDPLQFQIMQQQTKIYKSICHQFFRIVGLS